MNGIFRSACCVLAAITACCASAFGQKTTGEEIVFSASVNLTPRFVGPGVQWSAYPHADSPSAEWGHLMTDAKWETLYERLDYMKPRFMRVADQANWRYFKGLDENGKAILSFDNPEIDALYKILDYCESRGIVVMLGEWGVPGHRHDLDKPEIKLRDALDARWHAMIGRWVDFLLNEKGYTCIKYYDFINEPNGNWASTEGNFAEWAFGARLLHEEFVRRGLTGKIAICGPGNVPNAVSAKHKEVWKGHLWTDYAREVVGDILGAYNTHAYYPHGAARNRTAAEYLYLDKDVAIAHADGKPFFLGEIGLKPGKDGGELEAEHQRRVEADGYSSTDSNMFTYDYFYGLDMASVAIQCMNAGVAAMAAWDLDDAMHTKDDTADKTRMKRWGFWNILGTELHGRPEDERIRPWYWAWSWLCRYLPPSTQVFSVPQPENRGCQLLIAKSPEGYTICAVNTSDRAERLLLKGEIPTLKNVNRLTYNAQYASREKPYEVNRVVKMDFSAGAPLDLPAKTFIVLTTMNL